MTRALSLCGVILAAGESTRMGRDKALLPWPPDAPASSAETLLSAAIAAFNPFSDVVIVVVGKNELNLAPVVYASGASLVRNPSPERGQFSSLQVALHEVLNRGRDAAMVTLVDRPPPRTATLAALRAAFESAVEQGKWAVVPEYQGRHGHPIVLGREMIEAFLRAPATGTAREIEHGNLEHVQYVPVDDPSVPMNLNTPQDYAALRTPAQ